MEKLISQLADLTKALERLKEATALESTPIHQDASIQRFEFTFELSWKVIREIEKAEGVQTATPREAIRKAADIGLIDNPGDWLEFLEARNLSVHTYREDIAKQVYEKAVEFIQYVESLLENVKKRDAGSTLNKS